MNRIRGFGLVGGTLVATLLASMSARAESFSATNYIPADSSISSFPTNTAGTNGLNQLTGNAVSVANNEWAGFYFRSEPVGSDTTNNVTVRLVRGFSDTRPSVSVNTNNGSFRAFPDWETLPSLTITVPVNGTNATTWYTNFDRAWVGAAKWVGIYSIQNGFSSAAVTNYEVGVSKKIIPIRYP